MTARVICLDGWLKPLETRPKGGTVLDRFDLAEFDRQLASSLSKPAATLAVPLYNRRLRRPESEYTVPLSASDVVIVEGVVALAHPFAIGRDAVRIFVSRDEARRYNAFKIEYRARGFSDDELAALYAERQKDETPYIAESQRHADIIINTP